MEVDLQVCPRRARHKHPIGNQMPVRVALEPVRSYVSGTISGTNPYR
jgi:hypothetical protein